MVRVTNRFLIVSLVAQSLEACECQNLGVTAEFINSWSSKLPSHGTHPTHTQQLFRSRLSLPHQEPELRLVREADTHWQVLSLSPGPASVPAQATRVHGAEWNSKVITQPHSAPAAPPVTTTPQTASCSPPFHHPFNFKSQTFKNLIHNFHSPCLHDRVFTITIPTSF